MDTYIIHTNKEAYKSFDGFPCKIVNHHRDDGLIEVTVLPFGAMILLNLEELDEQ